MPAEGDEARSAGRRHTVLLVDGEILVRMSLSAYLRDCGYRVVEAASADEALVLLQHGEPPVDVVLADLETPGSLDGFGLSRWIRTNREGIDVILAASPSRAAAAAGDLCEKGPHLAKPYDPQHVVSHIRRLLAGRSATAGP